MSTRGSQPYRAGARPQSQALQAMLRGRTLGGFNPKDVERGVAKMAKAGMQSKVGRASRPPRPRRPRRPPR